MMNNTKEKFHEWKNYGILFLLSVIVYWPLTTGIFSVKNDAIHQFLPFRYFISESIHNGYLPLWSPYIYSGYPVHGDMQFSAWNPIVWFISLFTRYNLSIFHFEYLVYIFLGGLGFYKLTNSLIKHNISSLMIASAYMMSGFMLSGQLINWLAAAAFIPFALHYYRKTYHSGKSADAIKTGIILFLLLTSAYPSFTICCFYLLIILFFLNLIDYGIKKKLQPIPLKTFLLQNLIIVVVFVGLSAPAIISFYELLPYYQRGSGLTYAQSVTNSLEIKNLISLFFPFAIGASDWKTTTDIMCRNCYIGIFTLLMFSGFDNFKKSRTNYLLFALFVFSILISLGDQTPLRKFCFDLIPLMNSFRHPSQFRIYVMIAVLLLAAPFLKNYFEVNFNLRSKAILFFSSVFLLAVSFIISIIALVKDAGLISGFHKLKQNASFRVGIKELLNEITVAESLTINGFIQVIFLVVFLVIQRTDYRVQKFFPLLWIINLAICAQLVLPLTFVKKTSVKIANEVLNNSPKGYPVNDLDKSLAENSKDIYKYYDDVSILTFYNKKPGITKITNNPSFLSETDQFISSKRIYNFVAAHPIAYIAENIRPYRDTFLLDIPPSICDYAFTNNTESINYCDSGNNKNVLVTELNPNRFTIKLRTEKKAYLVLIQSFHHNWKALLDGKTATIKKMNIAFMGVSVPSGEHTVTFHYDPENVYLGLIIQIITGAAVLLWFALSELKKYSKR